LQCDTIMTSPVHYISTLFFPVSISTKLGKKNQSTNKYGSSSENTWHVLMAHNVDKEYDM